MADKPSGPFYTSGKFVRGPARPSGSGFKEMVFELPSERKAVEMGKIDPDKAASMRDNLKVAESWYYRIGLRNLETGRFTDEEVLDASAPATQEGETQ